MPHLLIYTQKATYVGNGWNYFLWICRKLLFKDSVAKNFNKC